MKNTLKKIMKKMSVGIAISTLLLSILLTKPFENPYGDNPDYGVSLCNANDDDDLMDILTPIPKH